MRWRKAARPQWCDDGPRHASVFKNPEQFDVGRSPNDHVAFGVGEHYRLGASLARLELNILFEELLRRLPDFTLEGSPVRLRSNFVNGIKSMPVRFTPEGRGARSRCRRGSLPGTAGVSPASLAPCISTLASYRRRVPRGR